MESMKRLSHRLLSLLAVLLLLAGLWVPAAPAQAAEASPCPDGEFWSSDGVCVALPRGYSLSPFESKTWIGWVNLGAGQYEFRVTHDFVATLEIDGTQFTLSIGDSVSVTLEEGRHRIGLYVISLSGTNVSLSWSPTNCGTNFTANYYYGNDETRKLAYGVCTPTLGGTWPGGVPTEVKLFNDGNEPNWRVEYSGKLPVDSGVPIYVDRSNVKFELSIGSDAWNQGSDFPIRPDASGVQDVTLSVSPDKLGEDAFFSLSYCAPGSWRGTYYNNPEGTGNPAFITCEARPDYTWPNGQPCPWAGFGSAPPAFRATWSNDVDLAAGAYRFFVEKDPSSSATLTLNGNVVELEADSNGVMTSEPVVVEDGTHTISLTYVNPSNSGDRKIRLWWKRTDDPADPPRCPPGTMLAEYRRQGSTEPDFATCEAAPADWGLNAPRHWNNAGTRSVRWSGDLVLLAGNYAFTPKGGGASLKLNGHQVVSPGAPTTYELKHGTYRVEASYTGSNPVQAISWTRTKPATTSCSDFTVEYSDGGRSCQPLQLPAQEADGPVLPADLDGVTWMQWTGEITFEPGRYLFHTPDKGVMLTLQKDSDAPITLDRLSAGASEPAALDLDGTYQLTLEYRLNPSRPVPRIWWNAKDAPRLVSYRYISQTEQNQYQVELTFDQEVSYPGKVDSAGGSFFLKEIALDEEGHEVEEVAQITAVSAADNKVILTATDDGDVDRISLSYFPSTEVDAIEGTKRPAKVELAAGKTVTGGSGNIWAPVSGVVGPTTSQDPYKDALELNPSSTWQVDLGEAYWLDEARVGVTKYQAGGTLTVSVSTDGTTWIDAATLSLVSGLQGPQFVDLRNPETGQARYARYVKLTYDDDESDVTLGINRFEVLGSPGGAIVGFIPSLRFPADGTAPEVERIELNVNLIVITYDDQLDTGSVPELEDYAVGVDDETWHPTSVVVQDDTVTLYLGKSITFGQDVKLSYAPRTYRVRNLSGHEAGPLDNVTVDPVLTEMINLAQYRYEDGNGNIVKPEAEQSSDYDDNKYSWGASLAIDNIRDTTYARTKFEESPYWQVDLRQLSTLFDLKLFVPGSVRQSPPKYMVLVSDDNEKWVTVYQHDGSSIGEDGLTIDLDGTKARYVRITTASPAELSLTEVEIWGYPPRITN